MPSLTTPHALISRKGLLSAAQPQSQPQPRKAAASRGWVKTTPPYATIFGGVYISFLLLLLVPVVQRNFLYLHHVPFPFSADFSSPARYGLAPFKTQNLVISTSDGESLGAWHVLPSSVYRREIHSGGSLVNGASVQEHVWQDSFKNRPTVIFFHGNAGSRAAPLRVHLASSLSSDLDVNVVSIDYRGFADSTGTPSESGLVLDARATWDHVMARNGGRADLIALVGQSLGTGVGSLLVAQLVSEGITPPVLALLSPYSSIPTLLQTFRLFRFFPLLSPLRAIPRAQDLLTSPSVLTSRFDSLAALSGPDPSALRDTNILLAHALDDSVIPASHSAAIFYGLLDKDLGLADTPVTPDGLDLESVKRLLVDVTATREARLARIHSATVHAGGRDQWATVKSFRRRTDGEESSTGQVVWAECTHGGHDALGGSEGVVSLLGSLWPALKL